MCFDRSIGLLVAGPTLLLAFFTSRLAVPLQMQGLERRHTYDHLEPEISRHPAYSFRVSARDLARFGTLFLNEGRFRLIPRSPTAFLIEDAEIPLEFQLDGSGRAMALRIWFAGDRPYEVPRVP